MKKTRPTFIISILTSLNFKSMMGIRMNECTDEHKPKSGGGGPI